jgi:hypothetical protein
VQGLIVPALLLKGDKKKENTMEDRKLTREEKLQIENYDLKVKLVQGQLSQLQSAIDDFVSGIVKEDGKTLNDIENIDLQIGSITYRKEQKNETEDK